MSVEELVGMPAETMLAKVFVAEGGVEDSRGAVCNNFLALDFAFLNKRGAIFTESAR
jgi:hypothetical protein